MNKFFSVALLLSFVALLPACAGKKKAEPVVVAPAQTEVIVQETVVISEEPQERTSGIVAAAQETCAPATTDVDAMETIPAADLK